MAYDQQMADRVRELLAAVTDDIVEKKLFGGLGFMVREKLCVGVKTDKIMVRIGADAYTGALEEEGFEPMVHGTKKILGFGFVSMERLGTQKELRRWVEMALRFNETVAEQPKKKAKKK